METPSCCFLPEKDTKRVSLIKKGGRALEIARRRSSNFGTRVLWPKDRELLTTDLSISDVIGKLMASNVLSPNNSPKTGCGKQNLFQISVEGPHQTQSPRNLRESERPREMVFLSPRMSWQDTTCSTRSTARSSYAPFPMTKVLSNLWIGTFDDANNEFELKRNGITHILSLVGHRSSLEWVKHKHYPMDDYGKTDLKAVLDEVSDFMNVGQKGDNSLLVHCQSGQNRSASVIIAHLMIMCKKTLYRAHRDLKKIRPIVQVNVHYAQQLLKLEQELFDGVNSLPLNWMEREFDESAGEILYAHENLPTTHQQLLFEGEEKQNSNSLC